MDQADIIEVLDEIRDTIIELDKIRKKLNNLWKKTNRVTGEIVANKKAQGFNIWKT